MMPRWRIVLALLVLVGTLPVRAGSLHDAVRRGDIKIVQACLDSGVKVDTRDALQNTPLFLAVGLDEGEIARLLLSRGASVHVQNGNRVPMFCQARSREMIWLLLDHGADPNSIHPWSKGTRLHWAVQNGDLEAARLLLMYGAQVDPLDDHGWTPLRRCLAHPPMGLEEPEPMAELLLGAGASCELASPGGWTPLHKAVSRDKIRLVEIMLKQRPNLEARAAWGCTVLVSAQSPRMLELLLGAGAEVNARCEDGKTALFHYFEKPNMVEFLLSWGADPMIRDRGGRTPWMLAQVECPGCQRVHELLMLAEKGQRPSRKLPSELLAPPEEEP